ncbi:cathepsin L-like proteinase [Bolinopsis microptera]|uniref:cathepsin L-like proteinase n=1 Tax=Bolinopsis microptera TaxID=2820187 RepID=UPI00307ACF8A
MRVFLILVLLAVCCSAKVDMKKYRKALKKTGVLKKLYKEKFGDDMTSEKLANFKEALQFVVGNNDNPDIGWVSDVNFFAPESKEKRDDILLRPEAGTGFDYSGMTFPLGSNEKDSVDWVADGYVREVRDQTTDCRACWAFAALVSLEGRYQILTNSAVEFSVQELIDCVYWADGRDQDGCYGGTYNDVYKFIQKFGHLAEEGTASYKSEAGSCEYNDVTNGLVTAHLDSTTPYTAVDYQDQTIIDTLLEGPITTAVHTTEAFLFYSSGVFRDDSCDTLIPNHAVGLVGYDQSSFRVKNSWGTHWGDGGYMSVARGHHGCGIVFYGVVPNLVEGAPTTETIAQRSACSDKWEPSFCAQYLAYCAYYKDYCAASCGVC